MSEDRYLFRVIMDEPQEDGSTLCTVAYVVETSAHAAVALSGFTGIRVAVYPLGRLPRDRGVVR